LQVRAPGFDLSVTVDACDGAAACCALAVSAACAAMADAGVEMRGGFWGGAGVAGAEAGQLEELRARPVDSCLCFFFFFLFSLLAVL
jgi:hypothetical protein